MKTYYKHVHSTNSDPLLLLTLFYFDRLFYDVNTATAHRSANNRFALYICAFCVDKICVCHSIFVPMTHYDFK